MRRFRAKLVVAEELADLDAYVIVLAEQSDGTGMRVEIQHSLSAARDRAQAMGTYCVSTESGATHYGGVTKWTLRDESLALELSEAACAALEVEDGFWIDVSDEHASVLREALRRVVTEP